MLLSDRWKRSLNWSGLPFTVHPFPPPTAILDVSCERTHNQGFVI